jgi:hypothetical protein
MDNKYLKPMLDNGSPRVFNCNEMMQRVLSIDPNATLFFRNRPLNTVVLIKDAVPDTERTKNGPSIGTKLYFPFNDQNIYEGGRTIFLHDKNLEKIIINHFGEGAIAPAALVEDLRILSILNHLPSIDPFLMKDVFIREKIDMNPAFFDVSEELWNEIETFMLQRFEPLVKAAWPDAMESDDKARQLIDKIWEARDIKALQPLITAFRLPQSEALDIFSAWRGIVYYSYQYQREKPRLADLVKWLKANEVPVPGIPTNELKEVFKAFDFVKEQLRHEWQTIDDIVRDYQDSYDKMFKLKISSGPFLAFLKKSNDTYWQLGNCIGRAFHAIHCWHVMTSRFDGRKLPWPQLQELMKLLANVFELEKKAATSMAWT